ncbi:MAG: ribonuclease P protein component [Bdellovibrionales bacterium]|nr:ribonuclease P protein component [Bdellovibrionales bacterium]
MNSKFTFKKSEHLTRPKQFKQCLKDGRRYSTSNLTVVTLPNALTFSRLGLVVSRRVGSAVIRNQWKRKLREYFRLRKHRLKTSCDIVMMVRPGRNVVPHLELLKNEIQSSLIEKNQ